MSAEPGWFPDPVDSRVTRFWTGSEWGDELVWNGASWQQRPALPPPFGVPAGSLSSPAAVAAAPTKARRSSAQLLMFVGAAVVVGGACLPWEKTQLFAGISTSRGPLDGGGIVIVVVFVAAVVWLASVPYSTMSPRRRWTLWLLAVVGALWVAVVFKSIDNDKKILDIGGDLLQGSHVQVGSGLFVFAAGIGLIWLGLIGAAMTSPKPARRS
jgi:hypothetical protein